ncbi:MAG: flavodoxin [Dactylosporangium sp.]|nr:flavodoxin domain-containing protein [Dactylosporangium sp.]NNJ63082.1 flavodoxin [Dactylosporangium sp.]
MSVLVAYASRHGATKGIAERIGDRLRVAGLDVEVVPARHARRPEAYDAVIVGSATYMFRWLGGASRFLRKHRAVLSSRPVWLFSSGPLGPDEPNADGQDPRTVAGPRNAAELVGSVDARDHHVFFGAFDPQAGPVGVTERLLFLLPAARRDLPAGDFRDWPEIESWADAIASELIH